MTQSAGSITNPLAQGKKKRRVLLCCAIGVVLTACLLPVGLRYSVEILCVETTPTPESLDAIVVLGGDYGRRAMRAVELYGSVPAAHVFVVGDGDAWEVASFLKSKGIPGERIVTEPESHNTMQNARLSVPLLRQTRVKRAAIVTSWFHSRRALACFRKAAPDIEFVSCPTLVDRPTNGWPRKYERGSVMVEYVKLTGYVFRHGVWAF